MELPLAPRLPLLRQRVQRLPEVRQRQVPLRPVLHRSGRARVDRYLALLLPEPPSRLRRVDRPPTSGLDHTARHLGHLHCIENLPDLLRRLRDPSEEVPAGAPHFLDDRLPHEAPVHDEQPRDDLRLLELHQQVPHRSGAVSLPSVHEVPPEHPVVAAHHRPDIHLEALLMVRVAPRRGDGTGDAEEQHAGEIVGEGLGLALRQRVALPPVPGELLLEIEGTVNDEGPARIVMADPVERPQERVLLERLGRDPCEHRKVGGGGPVLELGCAQRIEDTVDGPGGEDLARGGGVGVGISARDPVDGGRNTEILGEPPEQSDRSGSTRTVVPDTVQDGPGAGALRAAFGSEVANELAADLLSLSEGAPLFEIDTVPASTVLD